jgi:hypothetical protein
VSGVNAEGMVSLPPLRIPRRRLTWAETKAAPASSRTVRSIVYDRSRFVERSKSIGITIVFDIIQSIAL